MQNLPKKFPLPFYKEFWNAKKNCLYDVVSDDEKDGKIRPNQIYAVSLPYTMLPDEMAFSVVQTVYSHLYATYGLRSLSPEDPEYKGLYFGKLHDRDGAYHQGTAWAFPLGAFITAYVKVHHRSPESILFAKKLLEPLEDHLLDGCIGSIAEIFDGNEPHISRGCYAQAWSVGEILRCYVEDLLNCL
jgi:glycogen debranching enzyme